jgi:hypothetical protein
MKHLIIIPALLMSSNLLASEKQEKIDNFIERKVNIHVSFKAGVCRTLSEQVEHFRDDNGQLSMPTELLEYWQKKAEQAEQDITKYVEVCADYIKDYERIFIFLELEAEGLKNQK